MDEQKGDGDVVPRSNKIHVNPNIVTQQHCMIESLVGQVSHDHSHRVFVRWALNDYQTTEEDLDGDDVNDIDVGVKDVQRKSLSLTLYEDRLDETQVQEDSDVNPISASKRRKVELAMENISTTTELISTPTTTTTTTTTTTATASFSTIRGAKSSVVPLLHADPCPLWKQPEVQVLQRRLAVIVLIESLDAHVLITLRPPHMRTFPNVWVMPGGGVDPGEDFETAAIREVKEETGISIDAVEIMAFFESCYPVVWPTKRTHCVALTLAKVPLNHHQIKLSLQENEVKHAGWLSPGQVATVMKGGPHQRNSVTIEDSDATFVDAVNKDHRHDLDPVVNGHLKLGDNGDCERLSTGTWKALQEFHESWLEQATKD